MSWPWLTKMRKHSVADTESALISDLFDIFVRIVHNARFRLLSKQQMLTFEFSFCTLLMSYVQQQLGLCDDALTLSWSSLLWHVIFVLSIQATAEVSFFMVRVPHNAR